MIKNIVERISDSTFFSIQIDESTDITVYQQMSIMLLYLDNMDGKVCCVFYKLEPVISTDAEGIFAVIDQILMIRVQFLMPIWLEWDVMDVM